MQKGMSYVKLGINIKLIEYPLKKKLMLLFSLTVSEILLLKGRSVF